MTKESNMTKQYNRLYKPRRLNKLTLAEIPQLKLRIFNQNSIRKIMVASQDELFRIPPPEFDFFIHSIAPRIPPGHFLFYKWFVGSWICFFVGLQVLLYVIFVKKQVKQLCWNGIEILKHRIEELSQMSQNPPKMELKSVQNQEKYDLGAFSGPGRAKVGSRSVPAGRGSAIFRAFSHQVEPVN